MIDSEDEVLEMTYKEYEILSDIIYDALGDGLFGDALIDDIHDSIMQDIEISVLIVDDEDEGD